MKELILSRNWQLPAITAVVAMSGIGYGFVIKFLVDVLNARMLRKGRKVHFSTRRGILGPSRMCGIGYGVALMIVSSSPALIKTGFDATLRPIEIRDIIRDRNITTFNGDGDEFKVISAIEATFCKTVNRTHSLYMPYDSEVRDVGKRREPNCHSPEHSGAYLKARHPTPDEIGEGKVADGNEWTCGYNNCTSGEVRGQYRISGSRVVMVFATLIGTGEEYLSAGVDNLSAGEVTPVKVHTAFMRSVFTVFIPGNAVLVEGGIDLTDIVDKYVKFEQFGMTIGDALALSRIREVVADVKGPARLAVAGNGIVFVMLGSVISLLILASLIAAMSYWLIGRAENIRVKKTGDRRRENLYLKFGDVELISALYHSRDNNCDQRENRDYCEWNTRAPNSLRRRALQVGTVD